MAKKTKPNVRVAIGAGVNDAAVQRAFKGVEQRARRVASERLEVRVTKAERKMLDDLAARCGISVSMVVRLALRWAPQLVKHMPEAFSAAPNSGVTVLRDKGDGTVEVVDPTKPIRVSLTDKDYPELDGEYVCKSRKGGEWEMQRISKPKGRAKR